MPEWLNIALWFVWSGSAVLCLIHLASIITMEVTHNRALLRCLYTVGTY